MAIPEFRGMGPWLEEYGTQLQDFASWVAHEEMFSMSYDMHDGQEIEQKVLCVRRRDGKVEGWPRGSWTDIFAGSLGNAA